ncbi:hypothetical protein AB1Y20_017124 [Prymnesium parvum]|uniref:Uncharacterized protein n=1 Tax=Prymnesium parvum TaxID=97485 RepID=A0AB34IBC6_PRYPA
MSHKRARCLADLHLWQPRKLPLALASRTPAEVSWALELLLAASCPADASAPPDRLDAIASLPRLPALLPALLPLAAPAGPAASPLAPHPPRLAHLAALSRLHRRQAWLLLRNLSLLADNEPSLAASPPLRQLLLSTCRAALAPHPPPQPSAPHPHPPLLASDFDPSIHGYAAEVLSNLCRQLKLDEWGPDALIGGEPCTAARLCSLLASLLLSAEPALVLPTIEAFARLAVVEENEVHLMRLIEEEPAVITVFANALSGQAEVGRDTQDAQLAAQFAQEAALECLYSLSSLSLAPPHSAAVLSAKAALARAPSLLPRLLGLLQQPTPPHLSRRAAQLLLNLASAPANHALFRPYEWVFAYFALHPQAETHTAVAPIAADILTELG